MSNAVIQKMNEEGAKNLFQLAISLIKKAGKITTDEIKIRRASDQYAENYVRRFCSIKILGMVNPIPLNNLYTEVHIISPDYIIKERHINDLEDTFRKSRGNFSNSDRRLSGIEIANKEKKLNILGAPGSGKSTFLRKIGLECLLTYSEPSPEHYKHNCIPILVELKRFKNEDVNIHSLIKKEFDISGFPESDTFVNRALKEGKLLILLDGLDEVPENKLNQVLENIKDFTDKYHNNRYITSCRTAFYKNYLTDFVDVEISCFNDLQIKQFINNWFSTDIDLEANTSLTFQNLLFKGGNDATLELARTPLLLAFLCMTFDESQRFPSNRSSLYKQALTILMQRWAAEKRIHNEDIYQDLNLELELEMLADVASYFYVDDKIFFLGNDLKSRLKEFLGSRLTPKTLNISKVLEAIEIQQGILVERSPDIYSFSHLTIQEYLTAYYYNSPQKVISLIKNNLFEKRWREVFVLLAGIGNPNDTLLLMLDHLIDYSSKNQIISNAIQWVKNLLPNTNNVELDSSKRIFFVSLLIRYKRYDAGFPNNPERIEIYADDLLKSLNGAFYDFTVLNLKPNISQREAFLLLDDINKWTKNKQDLTSLKENIRLLRPKIPLSKMVMGSRHAYRREIINEIYKFFNTPSTICNKNRTAYKPILKYMEGYNLLIDCAKSTSLTSKDVWEKICEKCFN